MSQDDRGAYMPTQKKIAEECAKLRAKWKHGKDSSHERPSERTIGRIAERAYPSRVEIPDDEVI